MATYTAVHASGLKTLAANTVDTVTLTADHPLIEVTNWSSFDRISFRVDGPNPAVDAAENYIVGPGQSLLVASLSNDVVKLISAAAASYTVQGVS